MHQLVTMQVPALIADNDMRKRDERFVTQDRHTQLPNPLHNKSQNKAPSTSSALFSPSDFAYNAEARTCVCPAGKSLYCKGAREHDEGLRG